MSTFDSSMAGGPRIYFDEVGLAFAVAGDLLFKTLRHPIFALRGGELFPVAFTATLASARRGEVSSRGSVQNPLDGEIDRQVQAIAWRLHVLNHRHVTVEADPVMHLAAEIGALVDDAVLAALLQHADDAELPAGQLVVDLSNADPDSRTRLSKRLAAAGARVAMTIAAASQLPTDFGFSPDIIRIAAPWFAVWGTQSQLSRLLEPTVALLHRRGCSVQIEGIGSMEQMRIATDSGATYFQGDLLETQALAGVPFDERSRRLDRYVGENIVPLFA